MDKTIQLIANYEEWQAVKKLTIDAKTVPRTVMEFLASLGTSIDGKIAANLGKIVDLKRIDAGLAEIQAGKGKEQIAEILAEISSRKINSIINEICEKPELQKNEQKELTQFCRIYALRKGLRQAGLDVEYSSIDIPGMRKSKKAKV